MHIQIKYRSRIEITAGQKESLTQFLEEKKDEIEKAIRDFWRDYSSTHGIEESGPGIDVDFSSEEEVPVPVQEPPKIDMEVILPGAGDAQETPMDIENTEKENVKKEHSLNPGKKETPKIDVDTKDQLLRDMNIVIPNGKVNVPYSHVFRIEDLGLKDPGHVYFEGLESVGLKYDQDTSEINGTPFIAGDHKIKLFISLSSWGTNRSPLEKIFILIINPDPKSLWKNIPTEKEIEYFKEDSAFKYLLSVEKNLIGASQRGRSHAQEGKPRDDDFAFDFFEKNQWYVLAVADGAGSAAYSRKGSQIACETVVEVCGNEIDLRIHQFEGHIRKFHEDRSAGNRKMVGDDLYHILGTAVFQSSRNIETEAKATNRQIKDYSTTLIAAICKKFDFGWYIGVFWVGDGGIGIYDRKKPFLKVLGESDGGEYAGQTRFLTMPEITQPVELYRRLRFEVIEDFTALLLMTDGVTDPKFETDANLLKIEKWDNLWDELNKEVDYSTEPEIAAGQLLNWLDFWSPGNHDDRTIVMLL